MIDALLDALWPAEWRPVPSYVEIRTIHDGEVRQSFYESAHFAQTMVDDPSFDGWDVYFGVLPRLRKSGTNADVPDTTPFLWADVDAKKALNFTLPGDDELALGKQAALHAINTFPTPPHIVVDSGGGYHCYWLLDRPEPLPRAQEVMRWIARELRGDFVQDGARILRVPATTNWKRTPTVARYLRFDLTRPKIRIGDLEGQMPVGKDVEYHHDRVRTDDLPEWLEDLIALGARPGERSEAGFKAAVWLLRLGRTHDEIRSIFWMNPLGIGSKVAEMSRFSGARWIDKTISAAEGVA